MAAHVRHSSRAVFVLAALLLATLIAFAQAHDSNDNNNNDNNGDERSPPPLDRYDDDSTAVTAMTALSVDTVVQYIADIQWDALLNVTQYDLPAFAYETDWHAIGAALQDACVGTYEFARLWGIFLYLASVPVLLALSAVAEALLPHVLTLARMGVAYVSEMDPVHQAITAVSLLAIGVCIRKGYVRKARIRYLVFKRSLELRYRSFLASLSDTSRAIAVLLPHAAFFAVAYVLLFSWAPDAVVSIWDNEALLSFFTIGYPLLRTVLIIRHRRLFSRRHRAPAPATTATATSPQRLARTRSIEALVMSEWRPYETILKYWVLWSIAGCTLSLVSLFVPRVVLAYVRVPTYALNVVLAWIHSPVTRGDIALYTLLSPLLHPYANRVHDTPDATATDNEAANFVMRTLVLFRVVPEQHVHFFKDLWSQGPALVGLLFVFTPGFVTARGCDLVGFGFPAYVTMGALADKTTRRYEWWLCYFCVAVSVDYIVTAAATEVAWLPLFYHAKLLLMMWLQFPYFRGAQRIFDASFASVFVVPEDARRAD